MKYRITPIAIADPIDQDRVVACLKHYSDNRFDAVLYRFGTWVFPATKTHEVEDCNQQLLELGRKQIGFETRAMDDGNFVVRFDEKIFTIVLTEDYRRIADKVAEEAEQSSVEEFILGKKDAPREHLYIGLFGRTRLLQDIAEPRVSVIVRASAGSQSR